MLQNKILAKIRGNIMLFCPLLGGRNVLNVYGKRKTYNLEL